MKIALFASAFYPHVGGVEELVRQLALDYRRRGWEPIVVTNRWPRDLPSEEVYEGIPIYRLPLRTPFGGAKAVVTYALSHWLVERQVRALLQAHGTQLIHVQCVSGNGRYAQRAARALALPLIVSAQGERTMDAGRIYEHSPFMNHVLRELLAEADAVTACSGDTLRDLEQYRGEPFGARGSVIYNGIQARDFEGVQPHVHPRPYVIALGRLVPQKGFDILLQAFARVAGEIPHDLLLAGKGPEQETLQRLALPSRVHLLGRADRARVVSLFAGADFFVLPSRQEPQGIVNLEAMASGKAVLATRVGGVPEVVQEDVTGLLVPGGDVEALAAGLRRLALEPGLAARLGAAGQARARTFDWPLVADQYAVLYRKALAQAA